MSQNENSTTSSGQRLCHMVKRDDFDGYGFNLHSEKGKPGQYIGKVDENSPAEMAGLRQGDRIIEVNAVNIGSETHKQVVQRIKTICNEVRLLVIDPDVEQKQQQLMKTDTKTESTAVKYEIDSEKINPIGKDIPDDKSSPVSNKSRDQNDHPNEQKLGPILKSTNDPNANSTTHQHNNNNYSSNNHNDNQHQQNNIIQSTTTTIVTANSVTAPTIKDENSNGVPHHQNFSTVQNNQQSTTHLSSTSTSSSTTTTTTADQQKPLPPQQQQQQQQSAPALNLPMTAAEMRAKLLARKKYDPKTDTVDLRKKFDIIQKL